MNRLIRLRLRFVPAAFAAAACWAISPELRAGAAARPAPESVSVAPATDSRWEFRAEPYFWAAGLDGRVGIGPLVSEVHVPFSKVLEHFDIGFLGQFEAHKGPWSVLLDGMYLKLTAEGTTPDPFYSMGSVTQHMGMGEIAVAYRVIEGRHGFVDVLAGARYNYVGLDATADVHESAIADLSREASDRIIDAATSRATRVLQQQAAILAPELQSQVRAAVTGKLQQEWNELPAGLQKFLRNPKVSGIIKDLAREQAAAAQAVAQERTADARQQAEARLRRKVASARNQLAKALTKEIVERLPTEVSDHRSWVDPFVGARAQWNLSDRLFLGVRADIGGFGAGSELAWQAQGALGYQFSGAWFAEIGYRHAATDYHSGDFLYDVRQGGLFLGIGNRF